MKHTNAKNTVSPKIAQIKAKIALYEEIFRVVSIYIDNPYEWELEYLGEKIAEGTAAELDKERHNELEQLDKYFKKAFNDFVNTLEGGI